MKSLTGRKSVKLPRPRVRNSKPSVPMIMRMRARKTTIVSLEATSWIRTKMQRKGKMNSRRLKTRRS